MEQQYMPSRYVDAVVEQIAQLLQPHRIYLYNQRLDAGGETTGFKLCVVAPLEDKTKAERDVYLGIDCDVPFDVIFYTPQEWESLTFRPDAFAFRIRRGGTVLYG